MSPNSWRRSEPCCTLGFLTCLWFENKIPSLCFLSPYIVFGLTLSRFLCFVYFGCTDQMAFVSISLFNGTPFIYPKNKKEKKRTYK